MKIRFTEVLTTAAEGEYGGQEPASAVDVFHRSYRYECAGYLAHSCEPREV